MTERARDDTETPLLLDAMLGKLSTYLRMCGYDAAYALDRAIEDDDAILELARGDGRLLVTRDRSLAARTDHSVHLESREVTDQLRELRDAGFALALPDEPLRCSACNGTLEEVERVASTPGYAPDPRETDCWRCVECGQHFWRGSHWDDVAETLEML